MSAAGMMVPQWPMERYAVTQGRPDWRRVGAARADIEPSVCAKMGVTSPHRRSPPYPITSWRNAHRLKCGYLSMSFGVGGM
jgi:hypothetical protein